MVLAVQFWERVEKYPPILCRIFARKPRGLPLDTAEIAARSGLNPAQVDAISQSLDWRGIDLPTAVAFMRACNADFASRSQFRKFRQSVKRKAYRHLRRSALWESYYKPLLEKWAGYYDNVKTSASA